MNRIIAAAVLIGLALGMPPLIHGWLMESKDPQERRFAWRLGVVLAILVGAGMFIGSLPRSPQNITANVTIEGKTR